MFVWTSREKRSAVLAGRWTWNSWRSQTSGRGGRVVCSNFQVELLVLGTEQRGDEWRWMMGKSATGSRQEGRRVFWRAWYGSNTYACVTVSGRKGKGGLGLRRMKEVLRTFGHGPWSSTMLDKVAIDSYEWMLIGTTRPGGWTLTVALSRQSRHQSQQSWNRYF